MLNWLFDGIGDPAPPARVLARIQAQQERSEILVSVAHRSTVDVHHTQRLELAGDGRWELAPV